MRMKKRKRERLHRSVEQIYQDDKRNGGEKKNVRRSKNFVLPEITKR